LKEIFSKFNAILSQPPCSSSNRLYHNITYILALNSKS